MLRAIEAHGPPALNCPDTLGFYRMAAGAATARGPLGAGPEALFASIVRMHTTGSWHE